MGIGRSSVALDAVKTIRVPMYPEHRLFEAKTRVERTVAGKKRADAEHRRREGARELNEELSQHYLLDVDREVWTAPGLLLEGKREPDRSTSCQSAYSRSSIVLGDVLQLLKPLAEPPS